MQIKLKLTRQENAKHHKAGVGDVVTLEIEDYLKGVLPAEIYESRTPMQAKCAQAVAARTYALRKALDGATITDTPNHQSYKAALAATSPSCAEAIKRTRGLVLTYQGDVIRCYFSNSNGGSTKRADQVWSLKLPYYKARADPWDADACRAAAAQGKTIKASHGVGLSQVGAEYAARLGEDFADILAFYYPGTSVVFYEEEGENVSEKAFTGKQLAEFAMKCYQDGVRYWYGTCYYPCTQSLYERKAKQYPSHYKSNRRKEYQADIAAGAMCCDCVGLIKGAAWSDLGKHEAEYETNGCPDRSANGMLSYCKKQGMPHGDMSTFPNVPGLLLHKDGHVGVSYGGGVAVEAQNFSEDMEVQEVAGRGWTAWAQLPFVDYESDGSIEAPETTVYALGSRTLQRHSKGDDVTELQGILVGLGYYCGNYGPKADGVDGIFGTKTEAAVKDFQADADLTIDGVYGPQTHAALMEKKASAADMPATYTVTIPGLDAATATHLLEVYPGATAVEEGAK